MIKYNEAINECLMVIGEQIIEDTISIEGIYEAEQADRVIEQIKREILSEGWSFNTDSSWPFSTDYDGYITLPPNVLRVDATDGSDYIRKDGKLFDKGNLTYKFSNSVACDVIWDLDFDDLPEAAQNYIIHKASRIMYQRFVGDLNMVQALMSDERESLIRLRVHEDEVGDYNIFDDQSVSRALSRTSNPTGIRG